jgi:hypothetical protein
MVTRGKKRDFIYSQIFWEYGGSTWEYMGVRWEYMGVQWEYNGSTWEYGRSTWEYGGSTGVSLFSPLIIYHYIGVICHLRFHILLLELFYNARVGYSMVYFW